MAQLSPRFPPVSSSTSEKEPKDSDPDLDTENVNTNTSDSATNTNFVVKKIVKQISATGPGQGRGADSPTIASTRRSTRRTGSLDNRGFANRRFSFDMSRSRTMPKKNVSWKQVQNGGNSSNSNVQRRKVQNVDSPKIQERPRIMNPLPRVAMLSRASLKKSMNLMSFNQHFDDRGKPKPQWDSTPFISIGKKNAWDDTMPKVDYYRLKYFGWL